MSCDVWEDLCASGEALLVEDSAERIRAERHFEVCSLCAGRAFLLDPSWAVRNSAALDFAPDELNELKHRLADAGRFRELERSVTARGGRALAASVAVVAALAVVAGVMSMRSDSTVTQDRVVAENRAQVEASAPGDGAGDTRPGTSLSVSAIGSVVPAAARVYEIGEEDFALVMVVHESLDL